jgi:putative flavoprotein involved in K+ transport
MQNLERHQTVIIGAGQAGLSVGYHLKRRNLPFVTLEQNARVGDPWRNRWDSLRLFTAARYDGLAGMPFPGPGFDFPTKDQMADYLEAYAARFELPVQTGVRVERVSRRNDRFLIETSDRQFEADNVVVAMATFQRPNVPAFAQDLNPNIVQLHSSEYRNASQLAEGDVLIAGAGNSGAEIGVEVARSHRTWMSGRDVGELPFRMQGTASRLFLSRLLLRFVFHRVLTVNTPMGRKVRQKVLFIGGPLIRTRSSELAAAGIERVARIEGVRNGSPLLADGRVMDVANVIWCTGFVPGFSWIDLPVFDERAQPLHERGIVSQCPGLYFVGMHFLYALSSTMIHGVGRDADYLAAAIAARSERQQR